MNGKLKQTAAPDEIMDEAEAAQFLHISERTLRLWRRQRAVPHRKPSAKTILYRRSELLAWLDRSRVCIAA